MAVEIYIIGAGPAGCATALALKKAALAGASALNIHLVAENEKPLPIIGETIPPAATEYLRALDAEAILDGTHLPCPGSISVWGDEHAGYNDFLFSPIGRAYHLHRRQFNQQLLQLCESRGVTVLPDTQLKSVDRQGARCTLELKGPSGTSTAIRGDFVVDASGIGAVLARKLGVARNEFDCVVSICAIYDLPRETDTPAHTLVCAVEKGWWYVARLPGKKAIVSFCTDAQNLKQYPFKHRHYWHRYFLQTRWLKQQCEQQFQWEFPLPAALCTRVSPSAILSNCVGEGWLAVGDAASSYDSMSSAGISKALHQGALAGQALANYLSSGNDEFLSRYQDQVFRDFRQFLVLHQQSYRREQRYPHAGFWQRRYRGIQTSVPAYIDSI